jgi:hypothetical protein
MHPHVREEGCRGVEKTLSIRHGGHAEGTGERSVCVGVCECAKRVWVRVSCVCVPGFYKSACVGRLCVCMCVGESV